MKRQIPTWVAVLVIAAVVIVVAVIYWASGLVVPRRGAPTPPEAMKKLYLQKQPGQFGQPVSPMPGYAPPPEKMKEQ